MVIRSCLKSIKKDAVSGFNLQKNALIPNQLCFTLELSTLTLSCHSMAHIALYIHITLCLSGDPTFKLKEPNHHWIAVAINEFWYLIDLIWCVQQKTDFYFLCDPAIFVYNHLPIDQDWQLLFRPVTKSEFLNFAYVLVGSKSLVCWNVSKKCIMSSAFVVVYCGYRRAKRYFIVNVTGNSGVLSLFFNPLTKF